MRIEERLREAELAFLNAAFRDHGWMAALESLGAATSCTRYQLIGLGGPLVRPLNLVTDPPPDPNGHLHSPEVLGASNWRLGSLRRPLELSWEHHYAEFRLANDTSIYDDACSDLDGHLGCQTSLLLDANMLVGLVMVRSRREGPCDGEVLERFARVSRQAQRAARVQMALGQEAAELLVTGTVQQHEATIILDRYGQIAAITPPAERLFDHPAGLLLKGLSPALRDPREHREFRAALARLLASDGISGPVLHETVVGRSGDRPQGRWKLFVTRLPDLAHGLALHPALAMTLRPL